MACLPHHSPWSLALPMWVLSFFFGMNRPPSNNLILEQVQRDVGAASALIIFAFMTVGAAGMGIISLAWSDKIMVLGVLGTVVGTITLAFWFRYRNRLLPASRAY
jgi:DHA1 family bicyclomycin/chloramphenicol resistance-like MFS transporter